MVVYKDELICNYLGFHPVSSINLFLRISMRYSESISNNSEELNMIAEDNDRPKDIDGPPPLPLNLREHKLHIFIFWGVLLLTSCIAPLVLYPSLHWGADLSLKICSCGNPVSLKFIISCN